MRYQKISAWGGTSATNRPVSSLPALPLSPRRTQSIQIGIRTDWESPVLRSAHPGASCPPRRLPVGEGAPWAKGQGPRDQSSFTFMFHGLSSE